MSSNLKTWNWRKLLNKTVLKIFSKIYAKLPSYVLIFNSKPSSTWWHICAFCWEQISLNLALHSSDTKKEIFCLSTFSKIQYHECRLNLSAEAVVFKHGALLEKFTLGTFFPRKDVVQIDVCVWFIRMWFITLFLLAVIYDFKGK